MSVDMLITESSRCPTLVLKNKSIIFINKNNVHFTFDYESFVVDNFVHVPFHDVIIHRFLPSKKKEKQ